MPMPHQSSHPNLAQNKGTTLTPEKHNGRVQRSSSVSRAPQIGVPANPANASQVNANPIRILQPQLSIPLFHTGKQRSIPDFGEVVCKTCEQWSNEGDIYGVEVSIEGSEEGRECTHKLH